MSKGFDALEKQLEIGRKNWKQTKAKADSGQFGDVFEDGIYAVTIKDAELQLSKSSSRVQVAWTFEFLKGRYIGKSKMSFEGYDTPDNQARRVATVQTLLGEGVDDLDIRPALAEIVKKRMVVSISIKTKGEFQNVNILKVLSDEDVENFEEEGASEKEVPEEEVTEENVTLEVGMKVKFMWKDKELEGEVKEILEEEGKIKVKVGNMIYPVKVENVELAGEENVEEVPEEPEEEVEEEETEKEPVKKIVKKAGKIIKKKKK